MTDTSEKWTCSTGNIVRHLAICKCDGTNERGGDRGDDGDNFLQEINEIKDAFKQHLKDIVSEGMFSEMLPGPLGEIMFAWLALMPTRI